MAWTLDARIPLIVVEDLIALAAALAGGGAAVLAEGVAGARPVGAAGNVPPPPAAGAMLAEGAALPVPAGAVALMQFDPATHVANCDCGSCGGRNAAALALDRLFQARVRGSVPWFKRVVALATSAPGQAALREALAQDTVTAARFRAG